MCMVALGVIQQYYIYLKTAIFFNKKVVTLLYLWLAAALAAWYNERREKQAAASADICFSQAINERIACVSRQ